MPKAGIDRDGVARFPLILNEPAKIRIGLKPVDPSESLRKRRVVAGLKVGETAERIRAIQRRREYHVHTVVKEVCACFQKMRSALHGEIICDLEQISVTSNRRRRRSSQ